MPLGILITALSQPENNSAQTGKVDIFVLIQPEWLLEQQKFLQFHAYYGNSFYFSA